MADNEFKYQFPDSSVENERLLNQHLGVKLAMGGHLCLAPIDLTLSNLKVLDAGTSDGYWLEDFKKELSQPQKTVLIGTDIINERFPSTPREGIQLIQQSSLGPFPREWEQSFDLVHQRFTLNAVGDKVRPCVEELMKLVRPGGWIQLVEVDHDNREPNGPASLTLGKLLGRIEEALGTNGSYRNGGMEDWFREGGFIRIGTLFAPMSLGAECPDPEMREQTASAWAFTSAQLIKGCQMSPGGLKIMSEGAEQDLSQGTS